MQLALPLLPLCCVSALFSARLWVRFGAGLCAVLGQSVLNFLLLSHCQPVPYAFLLYVPVSVVGPMCLLLSLLSCGRPSPLSFSSSCFVLAYTSHHSRLVGHLGWQLSFSCSFPTYCFALQRLFTVCLVYCLRFLGLSGPFELPCFGMLLYLFVAVPRMWNFPASPHFLLCNGPYWALPLMPLLALLLLTHFLASTLFIRSAYSDTPVGALAANTPSKRL